MWWSNPLRVHASEGYFLGLYGYMPVYMGDKDTINGIMEYHLHEGKYLTFLLNPWGNNVSPTLICVHVCVCLWGSLCVKNLLLSCSSESHWRTVNAQFPQSPPPPPKKSPGRRARVSWEKWGRYGELKTSVGQGYSEFRTFSLCLLVKPIMWPW